LPPHLDRRSGRWRSQESETMSEEGEIISWSPWLETLRGKMFRSLSS
jgi:hypothetical protein